MIIDYTVTDLEKLNSSPFIYHRTGSHFFEPDKYDPEIDFLTQYSTQATDEITALGYKVTNVADGSDIIMEGKKTDNLGITIHILLVRSINRIITARNLIQEDLLSVYLKCNKEERKVLWSMLSWAFR